ncbi:TIGR02450 family Trp-rich protein [Ferrimonas lipolytica]|uniref:TIGR02450 family Trp-rich protein n=1 Tax=Ferrimonas lipolytica TaxID=2724191 RepID=A0A6H1UCN6_9GAMM|nr:TIGR02450 family Trp-rich protein [Ferrimonas lipolytica]QIZ76845.1 TIGR02450 family Trp-rich protein [Ferrimonas lipolytica]
MNVISSRLLLRSKWTATNRFHDETHFLVQSVLHDTHGEVKSVVLQGINNRHHYEMPINQLEDSDRWRIGWT